MSFLVLFVIFEHILVYRSPTKVSLFGPQSGSWTGKSCFEGREETLKSLMNSSWKWHLAIKKWWFDQVSISELKKSVKFHEFCHHYWKVVKIMILEQNDTFLDHFLTPFSGNGHPSEGSFLTLEYTRIWPKMWFLVIFEKSSKTWFWGVSKTSKNSFSRVFWGGWVSFDTQDRFWTSPNGI